MKGRREMAGETRIHPAVAEELRKLQDDLDSYAAETERLSRELADEQAAREALERREVHIDDMPG
jgi:FtsZ-binding cell division protein ZapB